MFTTSLGQMFGKQLIANYSRRLAGIRQLSFSTVLRNESNPGMNSHRTDNLEKRFLVWTGKYKSIGEVPEFVSPDVMERARNRIRIRVANIMIGLTILGCIGAVISGKKASGRGESVSQQNLEWHKKYNEIGKDKE